MTRVPLATVSLLSVSMLGACSLVGGVPASTSTARPVAAQPAAVVPAAEEPTRAPEPVGTRDAEGSYEVLGQTYDLWTDAEAYAERGMASWYGTNLEGRPTASGEPFDPYAMTAAHRNLPLGTHVEVVNLENGRTVIVRVNDRGPFVDDRIIDLSLAAAQALGFAAQGTARVEVRSVD